ncbi:MAG: hypothetical protein M1816_005644 [Peltula sp. TS41687]|nr:MAG: hypothetical protein M1816_005644 [Peltula sp. TS41687]
MCSFDCLLYLLAILFPPLPVWVKVGICSADSVINILLCMLGFLPGLLHAWYIIAQYPDDHAAGYHHVDGGDAAERGNVTYYYVSHRGMAPPSEAQRGYGTTDSSATAQHKQQQQQQPQQRQDGSSGAGAGVPPSYEQAVRGDHKVQTRD